MINKKLFDAGCKNLFDSEQDTECEIMKNDDMRQWNKVKEIVETCPENKRLLDLSSDRKFHDAIDETVKHLEAIGRTAINQRTKYKRLHLRHAALTMNAKDLSPLFLQKAGALLQQEHRIVDKDTEEERPCESTDEIMESTK